MASRLANRYADRFTAFAFLAVWYLPPNTNPTSFEETNALTKQLIGYEIFGYWLFFSAEGSDKIIEDHVSPITFFVCAILIQ